MKTKLLLMATFLFVGFGVQASAVKTDISSINYYNNDYGDSFTFVERDVTFAVFQNGEFDFYINQRNQRGGVNASYQGNGVNISFNSGYDYDMYVQYDDYGAIIQVENIPIYYDYYGRVNRIGNTHISYDSGRLVRVGGLHVYYDRQGYYSHYSGYINYYNRAYVFHPYHNYFARPLFDFRIVSYNPYRSHYHPTRYIYYIDHSRNKYYDKHYKRNGHDTRRVAAKSVPNRYNDKNEQSDRRNTNERTSQVGKNTDRRTSTVNRPAANERTSQAGNKTERRTNTVNRTAANERTSQAGNNTERRTTTVNRPSQNDRSANSGRMAANRAPERTAQASERVQQKNNSGTAQRSQAGSRESNGKSGQNENSRGNSSRRN